MIEIKQGVLNKDNRDLDHSTSDNNRPERDATIIHNRPMAW